MRKKFKEWLIKKLGGFTRVEVSEHEWSAAGTKHLLPLEVVAFCNYPAVADYNVLPQPKTLLAMRLADQLFKGDFMDSPYIEVFESYDQKDQTHHYAARVTVLPTGVM